LHGVSLSTDLPGVQRLEGARYQDDGALAGGLDPLARADRHEVARHYLTRSPAIPVGSADAEPKGSVFNRRWYH
jgi:hypothetical protein